MDTNTHTKNYAERQVQADKIVRMVKVNEGIFGWEDVAEESNRNRSSFYNNLMAQRKSSSTPFMGAKALGVILEAVHTLIRRRKGYVITKVN